MPEQLVQPKQSTTVLKRKKVRRSTCKKPKDVTVYYCNINGLKTKQFSLLQIVEQVEPKIILLCETKLPSDHLIKKLLPGYEVNSRTTKCGQSGLAIAVKGQTFNSVLDVTSTSHTNILVTRISFSSSATRIILGYAPQETDAAEVREQFYTELEIELTLCKMAGDMALLAGDMNAKIECTNGKVIATTPNGTLLADSIQNQNLKILNFDKKCNGKWTHVIRTTKASSVIDYVAVSTDMEKSVRDVLIDEECTMCPFSLKKLKGEKVPQYSDHNAIVVRMEIAHKRKKSNKQESWSLTKNGLEHFHSLTSSEDFPTYIDADNMQDEYNRYEELLHQTMDRCFRKRKERKAPRMRKDFLELYQKALSFSRKGKAQRKVAKTYIQAILDANVAEVAKRSMERVKDTIANLTIDNNFSPNGFWELCKRSRTRTNSIGTSVITETGNEVFGEDLIRDAYVREFKHRLRERQISPDLTNYEQRSKLLCHLYIEESKQMKEPRYTEGELEKITTQLKKNKAFGRDKIPPEIPMNWGSKLKNLSLNVLNAIKNSQGTPEQWANVLISTIYKNKGSKKMLVNQRGIFLKQVISKIFEKINMNRIDDCINKIDPFQAGSRCERSTADQTFLLRAGIDHSKYLNRPLYVVLYDYSQCFDSLWLEDCLISLWKLGVQSEILSFLYEMNKECNIMIKTPAGLTEEFTVKNIVQQGSVSGSTLCSASTGEVAAEIESGGTQVGSSIIRSLAYVDDIATANNTIKDVYYSHGRVVWFSKKKRLSLNGPKCLLLPINLKPSDVIPQLFIEGNEVQVKTAVKYLGDEFNDKGTNTHLVEERVKKGKSCIISAMSICSDITMGIHAIETLMLLYKSLFVQVVLYNAQAWTNMTKSNLDSLQTVQLKFLKRIFHAPSSTSNTLTFLETGVLPITYEIHIKQLIFLHHIVCLHDDDPVNFTYKEQLKYPGAPNWANEIKNLRKQYDIDETDKSIQNTKKRSWKRQVKQKVRDKALKDLNQEVVGLKQIKGREPYAELRRQEYTYTLSPSFARHIFRIRTGTIDLRAVRYYMQGEDTLCRLCHEEDETIDHVVNNCRMINRKRRIDIDSTECEVLREVAQLYSKFKEMVNDLSRSVK